MERGMIYCPNTLSEEEINIVLEILKDKIEKNPIVYGDPVLVDELYGDINVKVIKREEMEKICKETNLSEYEVVMGFMRAQNRLNK